MTKAIPAGMHAVTAQLTVDGAADALEFYKKAFGAEELSRAPDPTGKKLWHAEMRIGDSVVFLNDAFPEMDANTETATLWFYTEGVDAAFKRAVDAGAVVKMPLTDMFWGDRTGMVVDRWGIRWNISQRMRDLGPAEMKQATDKMVAEFNAQKK
jgi:PhnB protein